MVRRIIPIALVAVGLVVIALAVASATLWRAPDTVTASLAADPAAPLVVTDPGVLDLLDEEVLIRATAEDGGPVVLAIGRTQDVTGWVGESAHERVTGLNSWDELETAGAEGSGEAPSPGGSDMWLAEATGEGEAALEWTSENGRQSLIAATDGTAPAPRLELTWQRPVTTPFLVPGLVVGGLLVALGAVLAYLGSRRSASAGAGSGRRRGASVIGRDQSEETVPGQSRSEEDKA